MVLFLTLQKQTWAVILEITSFFQEKSEQYFSEPIGSPNPGLSVWPKNLFPILQKRIWAVILEIKRLFQEKSEQYFVWSLVISLKKQLMQ